MNIDPDVADMLAKFLAVNAAATLLLVVLAYLLSMVSLDGLEWLDRRLDSSRRDQKGAPRPKETF